jgi:hypothetical protein
VTRPGGYEGIKEMSMSNKEAFKLIGERADELAKNQEVQHKMLQIVREKSKEDAEKWLYRLAIATLAGI